MNNFSPIAVILSAIIGVASGLMFLNHMADEMQVRGFEMSMANDSKGALAFYDKAIMLNSKLSPAYLNRAQTERVLGDTTAALADCDKAIEIGGSPEFLTMTYTIRGALREELNDKKGAIADYTSALNLNSAAELSPINFEALNNRALLRVAVGDSADAIKDLNEIIKLDPSSADAYHARATAFDNIGDLAGALKDLNKSIELNATDFGAFHDRAIVKSKLGNEDGAKADFDQSIRLNPDETSNASNGSEDCFEMPMFVS
jgi:tetratricopeptide (TPR) repeat protein